MRLGLTLVGIALAASAATAHAGNQSSNTSSNTSSNNGVVRHRMVDTYCEDGYCERYVERRVYRDDRRQRYRDFDPRINSYYRNYRRAHDDDD